MTINNNVKSSDPSDPISVIRIPTVSEFVCKFYYNYYTRDESVNGSPEIPEIYQKQNAYDINIYNVSFNQRVPRYIQLFWTLPPTNFDEEDANYSFKNFTIRDNFRRILNEGNFIGSKYIPYKFSGTDVLEDASADINNDGNIDLFSSNNLSQTGIIDSYVKNYLDYYKTTGGPQTKEESIKKQIAKAVETIEHLGDRPNVNFAYKFFDQNGNKIKDFSGFDQLISGTESLYSQINSLVLPDLFQKTIIPKTTLETFQKYFNNAKGPFSELEETVQPFHISEDDVDYNNLASFKKIIGFTIDKFEQVGQNLIKLDTIIVDSKKLYNQFIDFNVKYNSTYHYSIKTIAVIESPAYIKEIDQIKRVSYLVASRPVTYKVAAEKDLIPPEPPSRLDFFWDYKNKKLKIAWNYPVSIQRDVGQFQVLRRKNIYEPFEVIYQRHFDKSDVRYPTGEIIDGNSTNIPAEYRKYVSFDDYPYTFAYDDDFILDIDLLTTSKYIYAIAVIDTHGIISNYSAQFEVSFDFFANKLVKKMISRAGAPRQYPNLKLNIDLFKDTISPGKTSKNLRIYFNPDYFKTYTYSTSFINNLLGTNQSKSYYKMQFINTQNQKTASLKITVDDPKNLANGDPLVNLSET